MNGPIPTITVSAPAAKLRLTRNFEAQRLTVDFPTGADRDELLRLIESLVAGVTTGNRRLLGRAA